MLSDHWCAKFDIEDFVIASSFMVKHLLLLHLCSYTARRMCAPNFWSVVRSLVRATVFVVNRKRSTSGDEELEKREKIISYIRNYGSVRLSEKRRQNTVPTDLL